MELKKYKLSEICTILAGGTPSTSIPEYWNGNIPWLSVKDFTNVDKWVSETEKSITQIGLTHSPASMLKKGDIILSARGTVGKVAMVKKEMAFNQSCFGLRANTDLVTQDFLYYWFINNQQIFKSAQQGNVFKSVTLDFFENTIASIPCVSTQRNICSILSALDEKIALNRAINQNLEALAKQLYDYWFVQFDFPNEEGKPYKSSGGKMVWNEKIKRNIPVSCEVKTVNDIADVFNGATPSTGDEQNYGGDVIWITPKDLSDQKQKFVYQGERNISKAGYASCSTHLLPINTVLMSSRAPIGLLAIAKTELCTNQGFKSFVPKEERIATYLYYYLQFHIKQIEQLGTGTTFKEVSREDVLKFSILKPTDTILDLWEERVSALNEKQLELQKENENLVKQRNELLPLLMNGQVSFQNCD